jgi:hypothetical protein
MRKHLSRRPGFPDFSLVREHDLIGDAAGECHFVCDEHHGHPALGEIFHHLEYFDGEFGIQRRGDFIEA